ncbi:MAG TPA: HAMP domain-containing sensor histidine kinase [Actinomycetota bacterium]|nr:HAMP domain-containing sensor histidine kinase [Actinomycetota bacterium]
MASALRAGSDPEAPHTVAGLFAAAARGIRGALGTDRARVSVSLPDAAARLRTVWAEPDGGDRGRLRATRRMAFVTRTSQRVVLTSGRGAVVAFLPLLEGDDAIGVLEVSVPEPVPVHRWPAVEAIGDQLAVALRGLLVRRRLERRVTGLEELVSLSGRLLAATSDEGIVRAAARFVFARRGGPVAVWMGHDAAARLRFAFALGLAPRAERRLEEELRQVGAWSRTGADERERLLRRYARIAGCQAEAVDGGRALLLAPRPPADGELPELGPLVRAALGRRRPTVRAGVDGEREVGMAWAGHELRRPLIGVRAVLEFLLREETDEGRRWMLTRSVGELQRLADLTDGLLRWTTAEAPLERRPVDLSQVVRRSVASCGFETGQEGRIDLRTDGPVPLDADPEQLGVAIANLIRNALAYSPDGSPVTVRVDRRDGHAQVLVRDRGPGVPRDEEGSIFQPFVRGVGGAARPGTGLGLFIAKTIVEAHGGRIGMDTARRGATFWIELPVGSS